MDWFRAIHIGWHRPYLDPIFHALSVIGLGEVETLIAISLLFFRKTRMYALPLLVVLLASSLTSQIPKRLILRDRPSLLLIAHPQELWRYNSFPSGHATSAFACAFMMLFITFGTKRGWIGWCSLLLALLIGISRIYRGVHWPTDVLAGIFVGCFTAAVCYLILDRIGKITDLDQPEATLTGREVGEAETPEKN